jgi:hypothetical protein
VEYSSGQNVEDSRGHSDTETTGSTPREHDSFAEAIEYSNDHCDTEQQTVQYEVITQWKYC